jgi:hypothetical protein
MLDNGVDPGPQYAAGNSALLALLSGTIAAASFWEFDVPGQ